MCPPYIESATALSDCMTGRAIQGNIPFKIDCISRLKGGTDSEAENGIFPCIARPEEFQ